jgi:hypothetical protein
MDAMARVSPYVEAQDQLRRGSGVDPMHPPGEWRMDGPQGYQDGYGEARKKRAAWEEWGGLSGDLPHIPAPWPVPPAPRAPSPPQWGTDVFGIFDTSRNRVVYPAEMGSPPPGYDDSHLSISEQFDRNAKPGHNSVGTQFGGQTWFDVDAVINQRLQVTF